jgi:hypothetical protein
MRNLIILVLLITSVNGELFSQSCLPDGINFTTQAQIDSFQVNFPGCSVIEGEMWIGDFSTGQSGITNLNGLSVLTSVGGRVWICYNDSLVSLTGLNNITHIGGALWIDDNDKLENLTGLESLDSVDGFLEIADQIALKDLTGLNSLTSIGNRLKILNNDSLSSLSALNNLTHAGGGITIVDNQILSTLEGLNNIDTGTLTVLQVHNNASLCDCALENFCDYVADPENSVIIFSNSAGCNSREEVETACGVLIEESAVDSWQSAVGIYPNPATGMVFIELPDGSSRFRVPGSRFQISIYDMNGRELMQSLMTETSLALDVSKLAKGIYFVKVMSDHGVMMGKFLKQ